MAIVSPDRTEIFAVIPCDFLNFCDNLKMNFKTLAPFLVLSLAVTGCTKSSRNLAADRRAPWELAGPHGETILPDIFYAEASENQQVMPLTIDKSHYQIDRLIYPTLGNPSLVVRTDTQAELDFVLRLEPELYESLQPREGPAIEGMYARTLELTQTSSDRIRFLLVARNARGVLSQSRSIPPQQGVHEIEPSQIIVLDEEPGMPKEFRRRKTLKIIFHLDRFAEVPEGLYDIRFELLQGPLVSRGKRSLTGLNEFQYNAVRIFDTGPEKNGGRYSIINVTDTQVSLGKTFRPITLQKLKEFVGHVNTTNTPEIRDAAFITFNGDLHNSGSPGSILPAIVANTYRNEAVEILNTLKELHFPIFLTAGNHDGYVSMGNPPEGQGFTPYTKKPAYAVRKEYYGYHALYDEVLAAEPKAWPDFTMKKFSDALALTADQPAGKHLDIFTGSHIRRVGTPDWKKAWIEVPEAARNMVLYDGFNQWRRTYGPLYYSWVYGPNLYISLNSYELRQHRRSGWGMFTVNYGGGMSYFQMGWLSREVTFGQNEGYDITLLAHHDPRGGHGGKDAPYYFEQVDYAGMQGSILSYVVGEELNPLVCKNVPIWAKSDDTQLDCLHDGLQEWMRADPEFDCLDGTRMPNGRCDITSAFKLDQERKVPLYSGYLLLHLLARSPGIRTLLLGHTHFNSMEVLQSGQELVHSSVAFDKTQKKELMSAEVANPLRGKSPSSFSQYGSTAVDKENGIYVANEIFYQNLERAGHDFKRTLEGAGRELVILRMTSNADMTSQRWKDNHMYGFTVFTVVPREDGRHFALPQINHVDYYRNTGDGFERSLGVDLNRERPLDVSEEGNPIRQNFHSVK